VELLLSPYSTCKMLVLQRTASNSIEYEGGVDFDWIIVPPVKAWGVPAVVEL